MKKFICEECGENDSCVACVQDDCGPPLLCLYGEMSTDWKLLESCDDGSDFDPKETASEARSRFWKKKKRVRRKWKSFESQQMRFIQDRMFKRKDDPQAYNQAENQTAKAAKDPKARYYDAGGIGMMNIVKAKLTPEQYKGWLLGNLLKYACRANHKGQFARDIEKACIYGIELFDILGVKEGEQDA